MVILVVASLTFGFRVWLESWFFFHLARHYNFLGVGFGWGVGVILLLTSLCDATLATLAIFFVERHLYELHPMDEEVLNDVIDDK